MLFKRIAGLLVSGLLVVLAGCASGQKTPDVSAHWTAKNGPEEMKQVMGLAEQGVIHDLRITRSLPPQISASGPTHVLGCLKEGGKWLEGYQECENIAPEVCKNLGGEFNSCASPCRHDKDQMVCFTMCVPVCELSKD